MMCMLFMVSNVLLSVEYLHSMSCRHLLPLYVVSTTNYPREFLLYPMALCCCGLLSCFGSRRVGIIVGCCVVILSFCSPSRVTSKVCRVWSACGMFSSISD